MSERQNTEPEQTIEVKFRIPARVWWRFLDSAEQVGLDGRRLLAALIAREAGAERSTLEQTVLRLHHVGLTPKMIAERTGITVSDVKHRLYSNGLRANPSTPATRALEAS